MKSLGIASILAGSLFAFAAAPASASTYDWTLTGTFSGSGTLTTNDAAIMNAGSTGETITSITGTFNGSNITGIVPNGNDNIFYPSNFGSDGFGPLKGALDALGLFFVVNGADINIFFAGSAGYDVEGTSIFASGEKFAVSPAVAATPLPSTWIMMAAGLVGLFFFAFRRGKARAMSFLPA
jgi:hypothetical protein